jgi:CheY-like chemotaxis protein
MRTMILIVDDSQYMRNQVVQVVRQVLGEGYEIREAANGLEAIQAFSMVGPGQVRILMDNNMPIMNGIDAVPKLRAMDKDVPIIILTTAPRSWEWLHMRVKVLDKNKAFEETEGKSSILKEELRCWCEEDRVG